MRNLLLLIRKDWMYFSTNKWYILLFILWIVITVLLPPCAPVFFVVMTYLLMVSPFQFEENHLVCNICAILPVHKRDVVLARYLYAYISVSAQALLVCILHPAARLLLHNTNLISLQWGVPLLTAVCASLLMLSIILPLIYKFGFMKMRIAVATVYGFLVGLTSVLQPFFLRLQHGQAIDTVPSLGVLLAALGVCLLLSLGSMAISLRVACRKIHKKHGF